MTNFCFLVIQGQADATKSFSQAELDKTVQFLATAFQPISNPDSSEHINPEDPTTMVQRPDLAAENAAAMKALALKQVSESAGVSAFTTDVIEGRLPRLERGNLTLVMAA